MTLTEHFDVVIVGGGPGGYGAALYGASAGLDVALVERASVGGTCLHVGCIPAKELLETAAVHRAVMSATEFGIGVGTPTIDLSVAQARKADVVGRLFDGLTKMLGRRRVKVFSGTGTLGPDRRVGVAGGESGEVELEGDHVILAPGSTPRTLPGFEPDGGLVVTSDGLLSMTELPASAVVIGGGAIGCEFASMMADLGTRVTILEALPKILPGCDDDITRVVARSFAKRGIEIRTGVDVEGHTPTSSGTSVRSGDGESVETDLVVVSVGRRPLSDTLGLEGTAVVVDDRGYIVVDERYRTGESGVYAVGDVIATPALAHVAFAESMFVIRDLLGERPSRIDDGRVPWCIYCHPEVAFAGLSETDAKQAGRDVVVSKHRFGGNGRALILGEADGMMKVIAEKGPDGRAGRILGVQMVGPWVTELLGQGYLSVNLEMTADEVAALVQPHPTLSELFGESVLALTGRSLHG